MCCLSVKPLQHTAELQYFLQALLGKLRYTSLECLSTTFIYDSVTLIKKRILCDLTRDLHATILH